MFDRLKRRTQHANPEQADAYRQQAETLLESHQYTVALATIEKALLLASDDPRNYELKSRCLQAMHHNEEAIDALDEAIQLDPQCAAYYVNKGAMLMFVARFEEALTAFDQGLRIDPKLDVAYYNRARTLYRLERFAEALQSLEHVPSTLGGPQIQSHVLVTRSRCLASLSRNEEALPPLEQAVKLDPTNAEAWCHKGYVLMAILLEQYPSLAQAPRSRVEEARQALENALHIEPDNEAARKMNQVITAIAAQQNEERRPASEPQPSKEEDIEAIAARGQELHRREKHQEALECCEQLLKLSDNPLVRNAAYSNMSSSLLGLRRYPEALRAAEQAIQLSPVDAIAFLNKGLALQELHRYQESLVALDESLRLDPTDAMTHCERAKDLFELRRHQEALTSSEQALRLRPDFPAATYEGGRALFALNRHEEAFEKFQQATRLNPNNGMAYVYLTKLMEFIERYEEAISFLDQALQVSSNQELTRLAQELRVHLSENFIPQPKRARTVARAPLSAAFKAFRLVKEGEALLQQAPEEALARFEKATQLDPSLDNAGTLKGLALLALQRTEEALACLNRVLEEGTSIWALSNAGLNKGQCLFYLHQYTEALAYYEEVLQRDPRNPAAHQCKIAALKAIGRHNEAHQAALAANRLGLPDFR